VSVKRPRLKKGVVMSEWQDERGQWWHGTIVRDTPSVFKTLVQKIDVPGDEVPRPSPMRREH
jgi:hypothetical protein